MEAIFSSGSSSSRWKVQTTSAAVKSVPSCHLTSVRRRKVISVPSSENSQDSARQGV